MSRSPFAYPLVRSVDADIGGAADLQTDVMRFMAILALCLVAIFALVQSIPLAPEPTRAEPQTMAEAQPTITEADALDTAVEEPPTATDPVELAPAEPQLSESPLAAPEPSADGPQTIAREEREPPESPAASESANSPAVPPVPEAPDGFSLRFESDLALTRLVAAGQVGFYAMAPGRVQRMSVRASRVSFWDASQPTQFHEMESTTVPQPVIDALRRAGVDAANVSWGVTLPGKLSRELDAILREHAGGALVIGTDGKLRREAS